MSAAAGSILEAVRDPEADVVGNRITLTANSATVNPASTIGTTTDALEVNSAVSAAGIVRAISRGSLFLSETAGGMTLAEARSATGNIRIDVPDSGTTGRDLIMFMPIAASASLRLTSGEVLGAQLGQSKEETTRDVPVFAKAFVLDTNGDGSISPLDVLTIINYINEKRGGQRAEEAGEESQFNDFLDANMSLSSCLPLACRRRNCCEPKNASAARESRRLLGRSERRHCSCYRRFKHLSNGPFV